MLPKFTILGTLRIIEIYEFYNKPVLFACQNKTGHVYLAVWIDETDDKDVWLYTPISPSRFERIRHGKIDLHDAFSQPEDHHILEVIIDKDPTQMAEIKLIPAEELDTDWVPAPHDYLDIPDSLPRVVWEYVDQRNIPERTAYDETTRQSTVRLKAQAG